MTPTDPPAAGTPGPGPNAGPDAAPKKAPDSAAVELVRSIFAHARTVADTATRSDRPELAGALTAALEQRPDDALTVVVAGEIKRGKSSLLGALVAHPGVVPVDADIATSAHIRIRHGDTPAATLTRLGDDGTATTTPIDPRRLGAHVSMHGSPEDRAGVVGAELTLPHPLLAQNIELVDTPGVGGVGQGHDDVTRAALRRADVLVFTISAQQPVSRSELEFLAEATARVSRVVFVLTKADLVADDVRDALVAENTELIRAMAGDRPDLQALVAAPWVPTSALLAEHALQRGRAGHTERAAHAQRRSGVPRLQELLVSAARGRTRLRLARLLQLTDRVAAELDQVQAQRLQALQTGEVAAELARQQTALTALGSTQAKWRQGLAAGIQRLQAETARQVTRELTTVRDQYHEALNAVVEPSQVEALLSQELPRSLLAAWERLAGGARDAFEQLVGELADDLGLAGVRGTLGEFASPGHVLDAAPHSTADHGMNMLEDGLPLATQTFVFSNIANVLAGMLGVATGGLGFLAYGIGAAVSASVVGARRKMKVKARATAEFQRTLQDALFGVEGVAKEFNTELSLRILDAKAELERTIEQAVAQRREELGARRAELERLARTEAAEREAAVADTEAARARLLDLRRQTRTLMSRLSPPRPADRAAGRPAP